MRCDIVEDEEPHSARAKLQATVEEHIPDPEERRWVEPRLAHLLGLEEGAAGDQENLFSAWRILFERLAEHWPTILVFEDMQWADESLLDFLEYLLEWSRSHPIFVLVLARPELADKRPAWGAGKRNFTSLYLEPLSAEAMGELLGGLVPGLPDELRTRILDRAEGVPLYAVETVRMLLDRGLLAREGNVYKLTGEVETLEVPETLHSLVAARLDSLTPEERRLVQDGSVLGKTFTKLGLTALTGLADDELEPLLTGLLRKEILSIQADPRSPERGQYSFLQDIVKHVAYETISKKERKTKHLAAAQFLSSVWSAEEDEIVEVVAAHYLDAYEAGPDDPDAEEIRATARGMLVRAAERAASLGANTEAQRAYGRAIELTDDPLVQAELHERAGMMAQTGARPDEAEIALRAGDRALRHGGRHPSGREGLGQARRDPLGAGTHRAGPREHGASLRGALARRARRGPRGARRPARPLPLLRGPARPRPATCRNGARDRRGPRRARDLLAGAEHESDHLRRARTEARGARPSALRAPGSTRQRQAFGRPARVLQPRRHALSFRPVRGGRRRCP